MVNAKFNVKGMTKAERMDLGLLEPDRIINRRTISGEQIFKQRKAKAAKLLIKELKLRGIRK